MKNRLICAVLMALIAVGCASTTVFEKEDGSFQLVTNSATESWAVKSAKDEALDHCKGLGKKMVIVKQETTYHGADKTAKAVIGAVSLLGNKGYNDGSSSDDYRSTIDFKCK